MDPRRGSVAESQQVGSTGTTKSVGQKDKVDLTGTPGLGKSNRNLIQVPHTFRLTARPHTDKGFNQILTKI